MEALVLPFLGATLLAVAIYGFLANRPAVEEDEVKAIRPLLRMLHAEEAGLSETHSRMLPFVHEIEYAIGKGYLLRDRNGVLTLSDLGDRLRRTGKLAAVSTAPEMRA